MYCRGKETREELVSKYKITPIAHVKLLSGQEKMSCTNQSLSDKYYCFAYEDRNNPENSGTFLCGDHAAKHFLELINVPTPPLFDPLRSIQTGPSTSNGNSSGKEKKWNATAKQLSDSINILIICWNTSLRGPLISIKRDLEKYPHFEPYLSKIKAVNKIISKDKQGRKIIDMLEELKKDNPNLKQFHFDKLNSILEANNIPSYFE